MNIKIYEKYKPVVKFIMKNQNIYYEYKDESEMVDVESLIFLKQNLFLPCKISFNGLSVENIRMIFDYLRDENTEIFCYRIRNPKTNLIVYHAIFTEKIKTKKLEK